MKRELFGICISFIIVSLIFFYPIVKGFVPFPGDLLAGNYEPYKSYSFLGFPPAGVPHKAQGSDVARQLYPWKFLTIEELKSGKIPLWNPYSFSGNPLLANMQSGVFYPINVLFLIAPFPIVWTLYILLVPILSGFFTYLFLRETKLTKCASFFGGFIFSFSAFMVVWMEYGNLGHAFLWTPLVLLLARRFLYNQGLSKLLFLTVILCLSIFAGYIQLTIYLYMLALCFVFFHFLREDKKGKKLKTYFLLVSSFIVPLFLTAVQLLPTFELLQNSARNSYTFDQLSQRLMPIENLITVLVPDFFGNPASRNYWLPGTYIERVSYIGIVPVIFVFFAWYKRRFPYAIFFAAAALISYLSSLDIYPVKLVHSLGLPFLSTGVPTRILSVYCFSTSILAAIGFDNWQKDKDRKKYLKPFFVLCGIFVGLWLFIFMPYGIASGNLLIAKRNLILPSTLLIAGGFLIFIKNYLSSKIIIAGLFFLTIFDLFYFFQKITPFAPAELTYLNTPVINKLKSIQGIDRSWGYGTGFIAPNFQTYEKIFSPEGYDALFIKRYAEFISVSKNGKISEDISRADVNIMNGFGGEDLKTNFYRQRIIDLLGVKYILHKKDQAFSKNLYELIWEDNAFQIYKNPHAIPRVFLTDHYFVEENKEKIIKRVLDADFDPSSEIVLEEKPAIVSNQGKNEGSVSIIEYSSNKAVFRTKTSGNMLLFLSDNYFPGWKVNVDGKSERIYRANYSFRAVPVEKGSHEIVFWYYPDSLGLGLKISVIIFCSAVLFMLIAKVRKSYV